MDITQFSLHDRRGGSAARDSAGPQCDSSGSRYWRSLEELAGAEPFRQLLRREFPDQADSWLDGASRREFLRLMGASLALAGVYGCSRQPEEKIVPYVRQPEQIVPGQPLYYATAMELHGSAIGLLVETHEGRPTKVEGNPKHPGVPAAQWGGAALLHPGATDVFAQASVLGLYDPDRSQTVLYEGQISTWNDFVDAVKMRLDAQKTKQGAGLRVVTETVVSPTLAKQLTDLLAVYPRAKWHQYDPVHADNARAGARLAFGKDVDAIYHLDRADVIVSLDADFLASGPGHLRYARDFAERRSVSSGPADMVEMNRLYVIESTPTLTGARADHRLPMLPVEIDWFAREVAKRLEVRWASLPVGGSSNEVSNSISSTTGTNVRPATSAKTAKWLDAVVHDLRQYRRKRDPGAGLVIAGPWQPPHVHALVHAINERLGSVGRTVDYVEPVEARPTLHGESIAELVEDMRAGRVEMVVILGGNPLFNAPADLDFSGAFERVPFRVHSSLHEDETSAHCHWHIPATHFLESWSDSRAYDGTASIVQPMIAPLYDNISPHELLAALLGIPDRSAHDAVREFWKSRVGMKEDHFDDWWKTALHDGVVADTAARKVPVPTCHEVDFPAVTVPERRNSGPEGPSYVLVFRPDPAIDDGRFANNGWLQELPKPLTKLTWDNAAMIGPEMARRLNLRNGETVEIARGGRVAELPVWILPGQPDLAVTLHFGYGRARAGGVGTGAGFNVYPLRTRDAQWFADGATVRPTGSSHRLASTQHHWLMEGRHLVRAGTLDQWQAHPEDPSFVVSPRHEPATSFYPEHEYNGYRWGMTIDLGACTGCNACVVACQAENNIPVVGKDQVIRGRAMHWLRIDRYYEGDLDNPRTLHQPVACVHCELAPCELVCPVQATVHGDEGLNEMVYNRCVGTRYCSNNCPYKVRRFNFLQYSDLHTPVLKLLHNPDVTVRNRGVMEKCTYCVQRINAGRIAAEKEDRKIRDGEVVTACQAVCPSRAIVFGDLNDETSEVKKRKGLPLDYTLLEEVNTRPRTSYAAAVRNANSKLL